MRKIIVALQVSLDGFIEGPDGELDWVNSWEDGFGLMEQVDGFVLGGGMYPGYETYWSAIIANPTGVLEFTGRPPREGEIAYAARASQMPHVVLSTTLQSAQWPVTRIVRHIAGIREFKAAPGKDIHAIGGAAFVSSLFNDGLVDELRLLVHPIVLGAGKPLFGNVRARHTVVLRRAEPLQGGVVRLTYGVPA